jgi:hypothetical protein
MGAAGVLYELTNRFSIIAECTAIVQRWAPAHAETISFISNGVDQAQTMTPSQKQTDYVSHPTSSIDQNRPGQASKFFLPFDSFGFSIGIHMKFGKNFKNDKAHYNLN